MNEVLIRKAKKGDKDAFCRLMDENVQSMYKIAAAYLKNDEDVADAIQDTILSCYENLRSLRKNRYFKTWLIRILINKCKDVMQKNKLVTFMDQIPLDENRRQGSRRYGSGTGGRIYILCNQSSNGKEYPGCRRAF